MLPSWWLAPDEECGGASDGAVVATNADLTKKFFRVPLIEACSKVFGFSTRTKRQIRREIRLVKSGRRKSEF